MSQAPATTPVVVAPSAMPQELAGYVADRRCEEYRDESGELWLFRDEGATSPSSPPATLPLVLLPGAMGNGDVAWKIATAFRTERRVLSITYPGNLDAAGLAQGLLGLLRHRGIGKIALWGSSYGAWWAQAFAAHYPDRTAALWLGNTFVDGSDVAGISLFNPAWLTDTATPQVIERWTEAVMRRPDDLLRRVQLYMLHHGLPVANFHDRLKKVSAARALPVAAPAANVVVCDCDDDAIITPAVRARVLARFPGARHITLTGGAHYPHVLVAPDMIGQMRDWLSKADSTAELG